MPITHKHRRVRANKSGLDGPSDPVVDDVREHRQDSHPSVQRACLLVEAVLSQAEQCSLFPAHVRMPTQITGWLRTFCTS